ncbi:MAG: nucleotidyltransferase domain-containing protein [Amphritea sp.]
MTEVENIIVKHYAGSIAYGTNLPTSDTDFRGIFCAPKAQIVTPFNPVREVTIENEEDSKLYELSNFMKLYTDCNPNIIETLWVKKEHITEDSVVYWFLRDHAADLLSRKVRWTFTGYAASQMKRIKGHNKWINKPQKEEAPVRSEYLKMVHNFRPEQIFPNNFNIQDYNEGYLLMPYGNDIYGLVKDEGRAVINRDGTLKKYDFTTFSEELKKITPEFIIKMCEDEYKTAKETHTNYWKWKGARNEKRSALEEEHGYDTKHAMHIVRLLRMGEEILRDGVVNVFRKDAQELLDVRAGKWTYEELLEFAEHQENEIGKLYDKSYLRKIPDLKLAERVLMEAQEMVWSK